MTHRCGSTLKLAARPAVLQVDGSRVIDFQGRFGGCHCCVRVLSVGGLVCVCESLLWALPGEHIVKPNHARIKKHHTQSPQQWWTDAPSACFDVGSSCAAAKAQAVGAAADAHAHWTSDPHLGSGIERYGWWVHDARCCGVQLHEAWLVGAQRTMLRRAAAGLWEYRAARLSELSCASEGDSWRLRWAHYAVKAYSV